MSFEFLRFAEQHGVLIRDLIPDNKVHRVPTTDHPRKRNGSYRWDGVMGAVRNWATMQDFALYRPEAENVAKVDMDRVRRLAAEAHRKERQRHHDAELHAQKILAACKIVRPRKATKFAEGIETHPYLKRKGFDQAEYLRLLEDYTVPRQDVEPMVLKAGALVVPMRDCMSDKLLGVQVIYDDSTKLFLPGVRAKNAVFRIGRASETWLCEGLATAYSVEAGLKALYREACVLVCFSAGNIVSVAEALRDAPGRRYVAADHDKPSDQHPEGAGAAAGRASALPWVQPDELGDFNDLHAAHGIKAVAKALRAIL